MTDITLKDIKSGYNLSKINDNFETIEDVINDEVVHSTGGNNVMSQDLDMNSERVLNLPTPVNNAEAANKAYVDAARVGDLDGELFDNVATMKADTTLVAGDSATTQGYYSAGEGGQANYLIKTAAQATIDGDVVNELNNHTLSTGDVAILQGRKFIRQFGAVGDGSTDDADSFLAAIALGGDFVVDAGDFFIGKTLNFKKVASLIGISAQGAGVIFPSQLKIKDGIVGVFIHRADTNANDLGVPVIEAATTGADGSKLENLRIYHETNSQKPVDNGVHGVWIKARSEMRNLRIDNFNGNGLHIVASSGSADPLVKGNANSTSVMNVASWGNGGNGHFVDGADANACYFEQINAYHNLLYGSFDSSFLGNTYSMLNVGLNDAGAFGGDNVNARSVYHGTYVEVGLGSNIDLAGRSIILGGNINRTDVTGAPFLFAVSDGLRCSNGIQAEQNETVSGSGFELNSKIGGNVDTGEIHTFSSSVDTNPWRLQWDISNFTDIFLRSGNLVKAYTLTGENTAITFGTSGPLPFQMHQEYLGYGNTGTLGRRIGARTSLPTSGEFARGDIINKISPVAGGKVGWSVTTGGTAGSTAVFKEYGVIDA